MPIIHQNPAKINLFLSIIAYEMPFLFCTRYKYADSVNNTDETQSQGGIAMKRYSMLILALALICAVFAGCRRTDMGTVSPTNDATTHAPTIPATRPVTRPATEPATESTRNTEATRATDTTRPTDSTHSTENAATSPSRNGNRQGNAQ